MVHLEIKPFSVNKAWKGRRFKTDDFKCWNNLIGWELPDNVEIFDKMEIEILFGVSYIGADIDNPVKTFLDALQRRYKFNDSQLWKMTVEKEKTKKGNEFIKFKIKEWRKKTTHFKTN